MSDIGVLTKKILKFRDARNWGQFNQAKDLAISLSLEAAEVLEHFQWKNEKEIEEYIKTNKEEISDELSDVLWYLLIMAHDLDIDIIRAFENKMAKNAMKYPVEISKGKHTKYNKLKQNE